MPMMRADLLLVPFGVVLLGGCLSPSAPSPTLAQGMQIVVERAPVAPSSLIAGTTLNDGTPVFGGSDGVLVARLGTEWVRIASPTEDLITGLAAVGDTLWLATTTTLWSRVGTVWRQESITLTGLLLDLRLVSGSLWLVGTESTLMRRGAAGFTQTETPGPRFELWGITSHARGLIAVGQNGAILESSDGMAWRPGVGGSNEALFDVACRSDGRCVAVGAGGNILLREGDTWEPALSPTTANLFAVVVTEDGNFLGVGDSGVLVSGDGLRFSLVPVRGPRENLRAVAGRGLGRAIAGWSGLVLGNGPSWAASLLGSRLFAIHAPGDGPAVAVGAGGAAVERGADGVWRPLELPAEATLYGIDGPSASDRLAVGDSGMVLQFRAGTWQREGAPRRDLLRAVWYDGRRAMVVGAAGAALVREQGTWRATPSGTSVIFRDLDGRAWEDLWAVGDSGVVRHFDGTRWAPVAVPVRRVTLRGVHARRGRTVWVVGDSGTIAHFDGVTWQPIAPPAPEDLRVVTQLGEDVLVAGASGRVWRRIPSGWTLVSSNTRGFILGASAGDPRTPVYLVGEGSTILGTR